MAAGLLSGRASMLLVLPCWRLPPWQACEALDDMLCMHTAASQLPLMTQMTVSLGRQPLPLLQQQLGGVRFWMYGPAGLEGAALPGPWLWEDVGL